MVPRNASLVHCLWNAFKINAVIIFLLMEAVEMSIALTSLKGYPSASLGFRSNTSECTTRSAESAGVRQPARSKIRRHNNKLATVFNRSPNLHDGRPGRLELNDDPTELSSQLSAPGILKIFGSDICQGANYKSVLATNLSSARELVKEALER